MTRIPFALRAGTALAAVAIASSAGAQSTVPPEDVQQTPATASDQTTQGGDIVITGSRIRRDPLSQDQPIVFVDQEDMQKTGLSSVNDILQRRPSSGGGLNGKFNNSGNLGNPPDGGGVGAGAAEIDLRYLGSRRVLVLVDGIRYVNGASASGVPGSTDLNSIPESAIERVEVLQDGASAIYGSDAIAGVVNFVLDDRFTGLQIDGNNSVTRYHDGATNDISLTAGIKLGERGNFVVSGSYSNRRGVKFGARPNNSTTLDPSDLSPTGSSNANPTVFDLADGSQVQITPSGALTEDIIPYDYTPVNYAQLPLERYTAMALARYELTDNIEAYARAN